jgi:GDP-L-fucose synthase
LPALIKRFEQARVDGVAKVTNWGTGSPMREFLFVDDLAEASLFLMENYDGSQQVNLGVGEDITIKALAELVAQEVGYQGQIDWDTSKPDGTPRKLLDVSLMKSLGWTAKTNLRDGVRVAIADFRSRNLL